MENENALIWIESKDSSFPWRRVRVVSWLDNNIQIQPVTLEYPHKDVGEIEIVPLPSSVMYCNPTSPNSTSSDQIHQLSELCHLHRASILQTLAQRAREDLPYTNAVNMCIAVNPLKTMEHLYTQELREKYLHDQILSQSGGSTTSLHPHVYQVSAKAFVDMLNTGRPQSILVSGESGAGKTESTKLMLHHVVDASTNVDGSTSSLCIQRILETNPILEAFGNAGTIRNHNSSRFGKFTTVFFSDVGEVVGAQIQTYLLEKSRVVHQAQNEFRYNIFYQLPSSYTKEHFGAEFANELGLEDAILGDNVSVAEATGGIAAVRLRRSQEQVEADSKSTLSALARIGLETSVQRDLYRILAAIVHLERITFKCTSEEDLGNSSVEQADVLETVAKLAGLDATELQNSLCFRHIQAQGEEFSKPVTINEAKDNLSGLAKACYLAIFNWIVSKINKSLSFSNESCNRKIISLLDIFGFENFECNCFEQFCINYANEKLQLQFTEQVVGEVQLEYQREGVPWQTISYTTNQDLVSLIESKSGVLALLNEECMRPKGSPKAFVSKISTTAQIPEHMVGRNEPMLERHRLRETCFAVNHFAGKVYYKGAMFIAKNKEFVPQVMVSLLKGSTNQTLQAAAELEYNSNESSSRSSIAMPTVGSQFKGQLKTLIDQISRTQQHFVRCVKPNMDMLPNQFEYELVSHQLQCAGVLEALQVARKGLPHRMTHEQCLARYSCCYSPVAKNSQSLLDEEVEVKSKVSLMLSALLGEASSDINEELQYFVGKSKVFFNASSFQKLEEYVASIALNAARDIQRIVRGSQARTKYHQLRSSILIQSFWRCKFLQRRFFMFKKACIVLQSRRRSSCSRMRYNSIRIATIKGQCIWRRILAQKRVQYMLRVQCATRIQAFLRKFQCMQQYKKAWNGIVRSQAHIRRRILVSKFMVKLAKHRHDTSLVGQIENLKRSLEVRDIKIDELERKLSEKTRMCPTSDTDPTSSGHREPFGVLTPGTSSTPVRSSPLRTSSTKSLRQSKENNQKLSNLVSSIDERDTFWKTMGLSESPQTSSAPNSCSNCVTQSVKLKQLQGENAKLRKAYSTARKQFMLVKRKLQDDWSSLSNKNNKSKQVNNCSNNQTAIRPCTNTSVTTHSNATTTSKSKSGESKGTEASQRTNTPNSIVNAEHDEPFTVLSETADALIRGVAEDTEQIGESLTTVLNTIGSAFLGIWGIAPDEDCENSTELSQEELYNYRLSGSGNPSKQQTNTQSTSFNTRTVR